MSEKEQKAPVSFEEFKRIVAEELQVDEGKIVPEASFLEDLLTDSIKLVELVLRLEQEGINIPIEAAWDINTVGDAFRLYREQTST